MSIRLNMQALKETVSIYGRLASSLGERRGDLAKVRGQASQSWKGAASASWQSRMVQVSSSILAPTRNELLAVRRSLDQVWHQAERLRHQAERFGAELGGGGGGRGDYLVLDEGRAGQVGAAASALKQSLAQQGRAYSELQAAVAGLSLGGVRVSGDLSGRLYADCAKIDAFESSFQSYRQGVSEIGAGLSAALGHLDPDGEGGLKSKAAAGFCSYFSAGGSASLRGLKVFSSILAADPVNTVNGNFVYQAEEMSIAGASPLSFVRTYNSLGKERGDLGLGWTHNWALSLADEGGRVELSCADGSSKLFVALGAGLYATRAEREETIRKTEGGYELSDAESVERRFDREGRYLGYRLSGGGRVDLAYDSAGRLERVDNGLGAYLAFERDGDGLITCVRDHAGRYATYRYQGGNLVSFRNECGQEYSYAYDGSNNLVGIVNPRGVRVLEQSYDGRGRVAWQQLACRDRTTFSYDEEKRATTVASPSTGSTTYGADDAGRSVSAADARGELRFAYGSRSLKISSTDRTGAVGRIGYDRRGAVSSLVDALGVATRLSYDEGGALLKVSRAGLEVLRLEYGEDGRPERVAGPEGQSVTLAYDDDGRVCRMQDATGMWVRAGYGPSGSIEALEGPLGPIAKFSYDKLGRCVRLEDGGGVVRERAFDAAGRVVREAEAGRSRSFSYDGSGNLVSVQDSAGAAWSLSYTDANDLAGVKDPRGYALLFSYDGAGGLARVSDAVGALSEIERDAAGNVVRSRLAHGTETEMSYDAEGRVSQARSSAGPSQRLSYDASGRLASTKSASGYELRAARDAFGRVLCLYDRDGSLLERAYDGAGRLASMTDSTGAARAFGWEPDGLLSWVQEKGGLRVEISFDEARRPSNVTQRGSRTERTEHACYDGAGRLVAVSDAAGARTSYAYDACGRPSRMVARDGSTFERSYDAGGRLTALFLPDGAHVRYAYDAAGALEGVEVPGASAIVEREADGRVALVKRTGQPQFCYARDREGRLVRRACGEGPAEELSFDGSGRIVSMSRGKARVSYAYGACGRLSERRLGGAVVERFGFDERSLLASYVLEAAGEEVRACRFERDRAGRKIKEEVSQGGACETLEYSYDACGRLIEASRDGEATRYSYDAFGNRTAKAGPEGRVAYSYDACGRLVSERAGQGGTRYSYDACGRLTSMDGLRGPRRYSYDACGRLAGADSPEGRVSISYDALGRRATVAAGGSARRRACDPLRPYNDAAWIEGRSYMFDSRLAAAVDEDGSVLYVACDELGSPTHVFDEAGALLQSYAYDEFGVQEEPCEGRLVPFGFAGYEIDGTGMLFAQARSYDPPTGRFCSEDVVRGDLARPQTLNRYAYCRGNPVGLVDRDGREAGSGNLLDQFKDFWNNVIFGTDRETSHQDAPGGGYADTYHHDGGGTLVAHVEGDEGSSKTTGFSINMPTIPLPGDWSVGTSLNVTFPSEGGWMPEVTSSASVGHGGAALSAGFGFDQSGLVVDRSASLSMPNVVGSYDGARAGVKTVVAGWGEAALAGSALAALAIAAFLIADDSTGIGLADEPLLAPVMAWLANSGLAIQAIGSKIMSAAYATAPTIAGACGALR